MTGLTVDIPQAYWISLRPMPQPGHAGNAFGHLALGVAHCAQPAQVAFDVGGKYRHARVTEGFGHMLQGHGLAGTGRPGHQAVTIGQAHGLGHRLSGKVGAEHELRRVRHVFSPSV
ncbi:hypothetical protein D3C76_1091080 [compost metagenome]